MKNKYYELDTILEYKLLLMNLSKEIKIPTNLRYKKNNSITLDDIYYCDERMFSKYYLYVFMPLKIGESQLDRYSRYNNKNKKEITRKSTIQNLNQKHYIRIGEECPICYDTIIYKKDALLTNCGHIYHHECIQNYYNCNYNKFRNCPMCRQNVGLFYNHNKKCYISRSNYSNKIDICENFWNNINTFFPDKCYTYINRNRIENIHNEGMNKNCVKCIQYRSCKK